jgi:hypothetical protein
MQQKSQNTQLKQKKQASSRIKSNNKFNVGFTSGISADVRLLPKRQLIVPDSKFVNLRYTDFSAETIAATGQVFNRRFRPSSAYDVDPLLGNTSMPGFTEWASFYQNYVVTVSKCTVKLTPGGSSVPELIILLPTTLDLGSSPTVATVTSLTDQSYASSKMISTPGAPGITLESTMSSEKIFGSNRIYFDDQYQSLVTTSPSLNWYWNISGLSTSPVSSASTIYMETVMDIGVVFFNRKNLPN